MELANCVTHPFMGVGISNIVQSSAKQLPESKTLTSIFMKTAKAQAALYSVVFTRTAPDPLR